jgi:hypothetical protein
LPKSQRPSIEVPGVDLLRRLVQTTGPTDHLMSPEEGFRLVRAFLRITSPERRQAVLKYLEDVSRVDEAERTH